MALPEGKPEELFMAAVFGAKYPGGCRPFVTLEGGRTLGLVEEIQTILAGLPLFRRPESGEKQRKAINLRFGLLDGNPRTYQEVGRAMGVSRQRARQIVMKALCRVRHPARSNRLRRFLIQVSP